MSVSGGMFRDYMTVLVDRLSKRTLSNGIALDLVICARNSLPSIQDALKPFLLDTVLEVSILVSLPVHMMISQ